jgi:L-alanine-DL-glutamate epimerase-like enolase superfamily enzyme
MDTCMLGHKTDPVTGGVQYQGYHVVVPDAPGIGADVKEDFLQTLDKTEV